jgi:hypothetical protein
MSPSLKFFSSILFSAFTLCMSGFASNAEAQEFGATLGFHQTTADSNDAAVKVDGKLNFRAGLLVGFEMVEHLKFRSGLIYDQRHIDVTSGGLKFKYKFAYLDIPATVQYGFSEMFGVFGGMVFAVKATDSVEAPSGASSVDPEAESIIPILTAGVNFLFSDLVGFDIYYERGMGRFAKGLENHSTVGANFNYWF